MILFLMNISATNFELALDRSEGPVATGDRGKERFCRVTDDFLSGIDEFRSGTDEFRCGILLISWSNAACLLVNFF